MRAPKAILAKQGHGDVENAARFPHLHTPGHPRRRLRTNLKRGVTLTIYLVQNTGQLTPTVHTSETSELTCRAANHEPRAMVCATLGAIRVGRPNCSHGCLASAQCRGYNSMNCSRISRLGGSGDAMPSILRNLCVEQAGSPRCN
jgi:hypothetical protein